MSLLEGVDLQGTRSGVSSVPEPSGVVLLVTTFGIIAVSSRRRKKAA
jgi:hypothetical protein